MAFQDIGGDVPELFVFGTEQDNHAVALAVEGTRHVEHGFSDNLLDAILADGELLIELVISPAVP